MSNANKATLQRLLPSLDAQSKATFKSAIDSASTQEDINKVYADMKIAASLQGKSQHK